MGILNSSYQSLRLKLVEPHWDGLLIYIGSVLVAKIYKNSASSGYSWNEVSCEHYSTIDLPEALSCVLKTLDIEQNQINELMRLYSVLRTLK